MKWTKIEVTIKKEFLQELVSNALLQNGAQGVEIDDNDKNNIKVSTYFDKEISKNIINEIAKSILEYKDYGLDFTEEDFEINFELVDDESWKYEWQKYYHPTRISRHMIVAPEWEKDISVRDDEMLLIMNPGESFGTGTHPTTFSCLQALEMVINNQESLYDVGTGSGILSIAARKMGIKNIEAFDIDPQSIEHTKYNFALNEDSRDIPAKVNSLLDGIDGKVDIIVANILADILMGFIPKMERNLNPDGIVILSGIINEVEDKIVNELEKIDFVAIETIKKSGWSTIIAKRKKDIE